MEKLQLHKKLKKEQQAITLVALVITVIVLLILAGVAIAQLSGNGLFEKSKKAKIEQMRAEAKENIDLAIMEIQISESEKGNSVNLKTLHEQLPTVDNRITTEEYTDGDNTLNIVYSDKGMALEVTIDSSFNVVVSNTPKDDKNNFEITVDEVKTTSLRVTGNVDNIKDFDATNFTYVAQTSNSNPIKVEHITDTSYTVTGLSQGTEYKVYMLAYDNAGNERKSNVKTVTTESIPDGTKQGAITFGATTWTSGKASIQISTNESKYYIEYQINGTNDGNWTKATTAGASITVQNLNNNDIVYARLTDGTVSGNYANVTIADTISPEAFTIKVTNSSETSIKIEGSTTDADSGIKDYNYYVKTTDGTEVNKKEHTTDTSWEVTGLTTGTEYIVYMVAYDNAENQTKSDEKTIKVQKPLVYAPTGVVQYDAGEWSKEEIKILQEKKLYDLNASHSQNVIYKLRDEKGLNFTFGGFSYQGSSDSEIQGIITNRNRSTASNGGVPKYDGWQILETEEKNGKTYVLKLIHAGTPESFMYCNRDAGPEGAEYLLSDGKRKTEYNVLQNDGISINTRNWDMYRDKKLDEKKYIKDVHIMTYEEAVNAINKEKEEDNITSIINVGNCYWLASSVYNDTNLYIIHYGGVLSSSSYNCYGIRPIVEMNEGVYIADGDGTPEDPYILGKD